MARGDVVTFQDADDLWPENRLNLQLDCLAKNPSTEIVLGQSHLFRMVEDTNGKSKFEKLAYPALDMSLGSALIRKTVFDKVGLLDETLRHCDDWDWFMRARELGAEILLKATKVDGVYDKDPNEHADAQRFEHLTFSDAIAKRLQIMDMTAFTMCMEHEIPVIVFNLKTPGHVAEVVAGQLHGTLIDR